MASDTCAFCTGVLQGAIDYYILDKYQRLTNTKAYTKVEHSHETAMKYIICGTASREWPSGLLSVNVLEALCWTY